MFHVFASLLRSRRFRLSALVVVFCSLALALRNQVKVSAAGTQASLARWSAVGSLPLVPSGVSVLSSGKVLFWAADSPNNFGNNGNTYTSIFNPATLSATLRNVTETVHTFFCPGTGVLPDGRIVVNGGIDAGKTSIYNPATDTWTAGPLMNIPRGYNGTTPLWDGSLLTLGGSWSGGNGGGGNAEIYTPAGGWKLLPGVPNSTSFMMGGAYNGWQSDGHYNLISTGNGRVLMAGPTQNMSWISTQGNGSYWSAGPRGDDGLAFSGDTVMFDAGKILKVGGSTWNTGGMAASASAYLIDTTGGAAAVTKLPSMAYPRGHVSTVVLPNGQSLVIGGQTNMVEFSDSYAVLAPELYDPQSNTFTVLPAMSVARTYHSVAALLPDGRVISAGGGLCNCSADHPDEQILSPPYLFNSDGSAAKRPVIVSAPATTGYGNNIAVSTDSAVTAFSMVRMNATTHDVNNDQRRVSLKFTASDATHYSVAIPTNPGILLPGQWMLFALNAQGTPSVASFVTVSNTGAPVVLNPGDISVSQGTALNVPINASSPSGALTLTAANLPAGLSINGNTIVGTPLTAGSFLVTLSGTNGTQTVSTDTLINVVPVANGSGLTSQYYATPTLSGNVVASGVEVPSFNVNGPAAKQGVPATNFSARWTGSIEAVSTGATTIQTVSDDGVRVWINNQLVIDDWVAHGSTTDTATVNMTTGQKYPVTIEYYQALGAATMQLNWKPAGAAAIVALPGSRLYPSAAPSTTNLALGKKATQASTPNAANSASMAVDGNTGGTPSQTAGNAQDWWQVDLNAQSRVDSIQIWNRTDGNAGWLANFMVFVAPYDMTSSTLAQLLADPSVIQRTVGANTSVSPVVGIPVNGLGRYVRVQLLGTAPLSLAEVQVFGGPGVFHAPSIAPIPAQQSTFASVVSLQANGTDPDGNPLVYTASGLPSGVSIDMTSGVLSGNTITPGSYTPTITVTNGGGFSASTSFSWKVLDVVPQVLSLPAAPTPVGTNITFAPVMSAGAASTYGWTFGDGSSSASSSSPSAQHRYSLPGLYSVVLVITTTDGRTQTYSFLQAVTSGAAPAAGSPSPSSSSNIILAPSSGNAARLWVVNQDNDTVSVFDSGSNAKLAEVPVPAGPRTLARASDGRIWVVSKTAASISILNPTTFAIAATVAMPRASQPFGIVFSPADGSAFVTLEATGQLLKLNGTTGATLSQLAVGQNVRHLAMNAAGTQLLISRFITPPLPGENTAKVSAVDATGAAVGGQVIQVTPSSMTQAGTVTLAYSTQVDGSNSGSGFPNYLGAPAISPDGKTAWVPSKQDNINRGAYRNGIALDFKHTVRSITSRIDLTANKEDLAGRVDHNLSSLASAAVYDPTGTYLFVALEGNRQVAVVDVQGKTEIARFNAGFAPEGLAISADGTKLYVNNFMSRDVSVLDLSGLVKFGQSGAPGTVTLSSVAAEKLPANVLRGKLLFYDAADARLAQQGYMSCAVCHNDGGHDGRTWDFTSLGEGLRNTINLKGHGGMNEGFLHWSGNFDEIQDFEGQIRAFGGAGLMSDADFYTGTRSQPLGDKKAGISADLDALAAYVSSLNTFAPSPLRNADGTLSASALAGKTVYAAQKCASCHGGTEFTLSADASMLKNIGTVFPGSGSRLGGTLPGFDIPTLRDIWATAPYLHDGSAPTISAAIAAHQGVTLNATDLANLARYLSEIGSDEPAAPGSIVASPMFGNTALGTPFADPVTAGQTMTGVNVHGGWWNDGIQAIATPLAYPYHGGQGGGAYTFTWPSSAHLVRIYGYYSSAGVVSQLSFATDDGTVYGPYGSNNAGGTTTAFDYTVPAGSQIMGFSGRSDGNSLNAIGVLYGPIQSTVTISCPASVTYNGTAQTPCTANVAGSGGLSQAVQVAYSNNTNTGQATATATFAGNANNLGAMNTASFTIAPAAVTLTAGSYSAAYDGKTHALSSCQVSTNYDGLACSNQLASVGPDVGTAAVAPVVSGPTGNYTVTPISGKWSITPLAVTLTAGSYSGAYDGKTHAPSACASSYAGVSCVNSPASVGPSAGTGVIAPIVSYGAGIAADYAVTNSNGSFSIQPPSAVVVSCPAAVTYNGTAQTSCTATVTGANGLNQAVPVTYTNNTNVGVAKASASYAGDATHSASTNTASFTINPAAITVTAGSYSAAYDGKPHAPSSCQVSTNYDGLTCSNQLTSVGPDVGTATLTATVSGATGNYTVTAVSGKWAITPLAVALSAGSYSGAYDGNAHAPSACTSSYAGVTCANSPASIGPAVSTGTVTPVVSYATGVAADYTVTNSNGSFSILPPSTVAISCPATVTYTGAALTPCTASVTGANGLNQTLPVTYTNNINVGAAKASASYAGDATHGASTNTASFTIVVGPNSFVSSPLFGSITAGTVFTDAVTPGQTLTGLNVHGGWWIDGIQAIGAPNAYAYHGGQGGGANNVTWPTTEHLVRVYGSYSSNGVVSQIAFATDAGRILGPYAINNAGGTVTQFDYTVPAGSQILGLTGRTDGNSLNAIGVVYGVIPPAPAAIGKSSPLFGSTTAGAVFTDAVTTGQTLTGINVHGGWWIDGIQAIAVPNAYAYHGGQGGGSYNVTWPTTEHLVRIYGSYSSNGVISQIAFATDAGRVLGPYATNNAGGTVTQFDYTVPAGNQIMGFTGRTDGNSLNAIGVVYAPIAATVSSLLPVNQSAGQLLLSATGRSAPGIPTESPSASMADLLSLGHFANCAFWKTKGKLSGSQSVA